MEYLPVVVEEQEFAESKNASSANTQSYQAAPAPAPSADAGDGFMNIPKYDGTIRRYPSNNVLQLQSDG